MNTKSNDDGASRAATCSAPSIPMRETCAMCHSVSPVGSWAPDNVWKEVVHPNWQTSVICLQCFIRRADEKLVPWEEGLKLYPVSLRTHFEGVGILEQNDQEDIPDQK